MSYLCKNSILFTMHIEVFCFNPFQENTYILYDDTLECVIVDPGCYNVLEQKQLFDFIKDNNLNPVRLLNTHAHIDHVFGNKFVAEKYNLGLELNSLDLGVLRAAKMSAMKYNLEYEISPEPVKSLEEGEELSFGNTKLSILHIPGHAPGHVVFYNEDEKKIIGGDVLFRGSIGRTDLPGGDHDALIHNVKKKLFVLDDSIEVFPGHGPKTTIGYEKANNPFF